MNSSLVGGVVVGAGAMGVAGGVTAAGARGLESDSDLKKFAGATSLLLGPVLASSVVAAAIVDVETDTTKAAQSLRGFRIGTAGMVAAALGAGVIYAAS